MVVLGSSVNAGVIATAAVVSVIGMALAAIAGIIVPTSIRERTLPRTRAQVFELAAYVLMVGGVVSAIVVSAASAVSTASPAIPRLSWWLFAFGAIGAVGWSASGTRTDRRRDRRPDRGERP